MSTFALDQIDQQLNARQTIVPAPQELLGAEARIKQIRKEIDEDPLNARAAYAAAVEPLSIRLRNGLKEAVRARNEALQGLNAARDLYRKLVNTNTQAGAAGMDSKAKVTAADLASQASKLLYDTPTPFSQARDMARQFERSLNGR